MVIAERETAFPFTTENPSGVPGSTNINPDVVAAIAGHVASGTPGVDRLGNTGGILRSVVDAMRSTSASRAAGVDAEVGQKEFIIDLDVVVTYGYRIPTTIQELRENVAQELFDMLGLVAKEVNVAVVGIEFPPAVAARDVE